MHTIRLETSKAERGPALPKEGYNKGDQRNTINLVVAQFVVTVDADLSQLQGLLHTSAAHILIVLLDTLRIGPGCESAFRSLENHETEDHPSRVHAFHEALNRNSHWGCLDLPFAAGVAMWKKSCIFYIHF